MEKEEKEIKITPTEGNLFVEFQPFIDRKTDSGIYVAKPKWEGVPNKGTVYAIAEDIQDIKVGDFIYFKTERPNGFKFQGKQLIPVNFKEVLAVKQ